MLLNRIIYSLPSGLHSYTYKIIRWYYHKPRTIVYKDLRFKLYPTVFHPLLYLTTETFLDYIMSLNLSGKILLELGCGSGLISMQLAKKKSGKIHASDINPKAIEGLRENCETLNLDIDTYQSDLFTNIPLTKIDYVFINPPFFNKEVKKMDEYGFYAGTDYEYFHRLFAEIKSDKREIINTLMILTDKCELDEIKSIANTYEIQFKKMHSIKKYNEEHFIYSLFY